MQGSQYGTEDKGLAMRYPSFLIGNVLGMEAKYPAQVR
jgi:hypothetical protein